MKKIKITVGTYGYREKGKPPVRLINAESGPIEVSDEEAARLIKAGVAEVVDTTEKVVDTTEIPVDVPEIAVEETATGHLDNESLEECTVAELKKLASDLGLEFKSRATKDELIKLISSAEVEYPVVEVDDEEPPVLSAADPE